MVRDTILMFCLSGWRRLPYLGIAPAIQQPWNTNSYTRLINKSAYNSGDKCTFKARAKPERVCLKTSNGADGV